MLSIASHKSTNDYPLNCSAGGGASEHTEPPKVGSEDRGRVGTTQNLSVKANMKLGETVSAVRSNRVLLGDQVRPAVILIQDGKIQRILKHTDFSGDAACEVGSSVSHVGVFTFVEWL